MSVRLVDLRADDAALARAASVLTAGELARAQRGVPEIRRRRILLRAALRAALAEVLGLPPEAVELQRGRFGRPEVSGSDIDANCSASGAVGVVVVGRGCRVGVDVERMRPWDAAALDEGWLSPRERRALIALPPAERAVAAALAWTQKEAVLKARGTGLLGDPAAAETVVGRPAGRVAGWAVFPVEVPEGWVSSLAVGPRGAA